jgi:arylsulfatase A
MIRLTAIFIISSICVCCSQQKETTKSESQVDQKQSPNIIFILTDDQGWTQTSHLADPDVPNSISDYYETPNMDRLAKSGVLFTQGYAPNPICSPTRNSLMFGQNAARHMYSEDADWYKKTADWFTIPRVLKKANPDYKTAHFGKWHIAMEPNVAGFDKDDGMTSNSGGEIYGEGFLVHKDYIESSNAYLKKNKVPNPLNIRKVGKPTLYWSDTNPKDIFGITERAKGFMNESIKEDKPFYVQLSHYATHLSLVSTKESYEYFKTKAEGDRHKSPEFAAMLKDMDASIGMILDFVKEAGIEDNTYIFLMGDNGGRLSFNQMGSVDDQRKLIESHYATEPDRNIPLQDGKHSFYEGGLRVPFMAAGPRIKSNRVSTTPVTGLDLLPTFADLAGFTGEYPAEIDGGSMKSLLLDEKVTEVNRSKDALYFHQSSHRPSRSAVRLGNYKLIKYWSKENKYEGTPKVQLFDLSKDLSEKKDLSDLNPEKRQELEKLLEDFIKETNTVTIRRDIQGAYYRLMDDIRLR